MDMITSCNIIGSFCYTQYKYIIPIFPSSTHFIHLTAAHGSLLGPGFRS